MNKITGIPPLAYGVPIVEQSRGPTLQFQRLFNQAYQNSQKILTTANAAAVTATWGSIGGTLSNQADLKSALDGKQPLDGDLTAISALTGTNTIYYRSAADTWSPVTIGANLTFSGGTLSASGGTGTVTTTGTPASGNLAKFSGATSVTNGDLSGDVTTSGTLATTVQSFANGVPLYSDVNVNVGIGTKFPALTTGYYNFVFGGAHVGDTITSGYGNTLLYGGVSITSGNQNTAVGGAIIAETTGAKNTSVGYASGYTQNGASENTFFGANAGYNVTTGGDNTFIGYNTGLGVTTGAHNTILGANVTGLSASLAGNVILADGAGNIKYQYDGTKTTITGALTTTGVVTTPASATGGAGFNLPHGSAPTSPVNGDLWTTTSGIYARINGATVGPLGTGGGGGSGTVTSVSVTTANGVSGTVANPTTTPAITLTLGAITPSSVAATGTVTGSNLSGTNTGDQSAANPTATASDTAVNGSASTFMRSDAAPAIQKGSSSQFGIVKVDGTTITASGGVISASGSSSLPSRTLVQLHANTTIAHNTFAAFSWSSSDILSDSLGAWASGSPTKFTVPSGMTQARIVINGVWDSNGTGIRWIQLFVNGTIDLASDVRTAANETGASVATPWITGLTAGTTYFEVRFAQTSGANRTLQGGTGLAAVTRMQIEWAA